MKRVLLKLSGEALSGEAGRGFDENVCHSVALQIASLLKGGREIAVVIGGGNFWRGRSSGEMDRSAADSIGMLATVMNCLYMSDACRRAGLETAIFTPFPCGTFTEYYNKDKAISALKSGKVVFFAGGTGHPFFSTDTTTVLRALETEAEAILLAKAVDGIYDSDPKVNPAALKYDRISIEEVVEKKLAAMDLSASSMCLEYRMPLVVFHLKGDTCITDSMPVSKTQMNPAFSGTFVTV